MKKELNREDINLLLEKARRVVIVDKDGSTIDQAGKPVDINELIDDANERDAKNQIKEIAKHKRKRKQIKKLLKEMSDIELLETLKLNGCETSYTNLCLLKEGIENSTIVDEEEVEENPTEVEKVQENEEQPQPSKSATITPDGTLQMSAGNAEVVATPDGAMTANLYESEEVAEEQPIEEEIPAEENAQVEEAPAEAPEGEYPQEDAVENGAAPRIMISMPVDGSMTIDNQGKQIMADAQGNVNVALAEAFRSKRNTERFLNSFLTEDCYMQLKEYQTLTEEVKAETVKDIATFLLQTIEEKITSVDTTCADRSRGDVKQLKELQPIQDALTQLEALLERSEEAQPECKQAVSIIIKAILYLNQYSAVFKEAYRNKKTVMILKYQSVILSIISSISYILSVAVDYKGGNIKIKRDIPELKEFAPLKSLEEFVVSVDSGEFKTITKDVNFLREYYLEVSVEQMSSLLEATDYVDMIVGSVKNIYDQLTTGDLGTKISDILYKAIGVITLLLSLRSTLYTLFRMKTRVSDMIGGIQQFANANNGGGALSKLTQFANKFRVDAENGSEISQHEIDIENKRVLNQVRTVQTNTMINRDNDDFKPEELVSNKTIDTNNDFGFDF